MGQYEVLEFLAGNAEEWFTARQIAEQTDHPFSSVVNSVRRLRKSGMVEFKKVAGKTISGCCSRRVHAYKGATASVPRVPSGLQGKV